ncbi:MAG: exodeoxyribonuclease VII small subunit [Verrucomicrobiota bacterium]
MSKSATSKDQESFEDSLQRLEEIIEHMDDEESSIDQVLSRYQEGSDLLIKCRKQIHTFHEKVEKITKALEEDVPQLSAFEDEN